MGISVISSYRGGYNFEAVGLSRSLVAEFFPGMLSRISGIGLAGIQHKILSLHQRAYEADVIALPIGGLYKLRKGGEVHAFEGSLIHTLQTAVERESYSTYKSYSDGMGQLPPINLRDLLDFRPDRPAVSLDEVESITEIRKRFVTPGMSLGALRARGARNSDRGDEPDRRQVGFRRRRRRAGTHSARGRTATTRTRRSSRSRRAGSASPPNTSTTAAKWKSRSPRAPSRRRRPASRLQGDGRDRPACGTRRRESP